MKTIKIDCGNTRLIAHRGVSALECENTCAAFLLAGFGNYYGIETDLRLTADDKFIIFHDDEAKRLLGIDMPIASFTFDELRSMRITSPREGFSRCDLIMPTLAEYIGICKRYNRRAILELKGELSPTHIERIIGEIVALGYLNGVTFISFFKGTLLNLRKALPEAEIQFLTNMANDETMRFIVDNRFDLDILYSSLTADYVRLVHGNGRKVNCWTVDTVDEANTMLSWGVDFITSNSLEGIQ